MEKGEIWEIMKTIVLSNQKGGVGKTTTSNALAAGLNNRGYRVLAVDLDPQCNLSLSCGVDMLAAEETLYHVFKGESGVTGWPDAIWGGYGFHADRAGIYAF